MTDAEIRALADDAAEKAVNRLLVKLGVDPENEQDVDGLKQDMRHLRAWREATNIVKIAGIRAAVTVIVTGALGAIWLIVKGNTH